MMMAMPVPQVQLSIKVDFGSLPDCSISQQLSHCRRQHCNNNRSNHTDPDFIFASFGVPPKNWPQKVQNEGAAQVCGEKEK